MTSVLKIAVNDEIFQSQATAIRLVTYSKRSFDANLLPASEVGKDLVHFCYSPNNI